MSAHHCDLNSFPISGDVCWMTRLSLGKKGREMSICAGCDSRAAVNAARELDGPTCTCPVMLATVPAADCGRMVFQRCHTCIHAPKPVKAPAPAPAITTKEKEKDIDMEKEKCACGKPGEVRKFGSRPTLCFDCKEEWDAGKKPATKPTPRPAPTKKAAPVAKAPLAAPREPELERDAGSMTRHMMDLTGQFLGVIEDPEFPVDKKADILLHLAEGTNALSKVALIRAEASLR